MPAGSSINDVLEQLDAVIARARREQSRLGYFAVLYRNVTQKVKEGIEAGRFDDGARMEHLDVIFASRYLDALESHRRGERASKCWAASFEAAENWHPLVLQHLLLGINAHINLDLGVAAALAAPGAQLPALRRDFDEINNILCAMLDDVQNRLARVSRWMTVLDRAGCRTDEALMNFSINRAREASWRLAEKLAPLSDDEREREIRELDRWIEILARLIQYPGIPLRIANFFVRLTETRDVGKVIDILT
ncbi:MAG TPA: DUF5995 family protein [Pyrinomonadaceae bacterium]|jgi:hypothetical protein|nr:DUF5995 family protein [Pyrinomonadaceae bacterium]